MSFAWLGVLALLIRRVGHAAQTGAPARECRAPVAVHRLGIGGSHPAARGALALAADYVHLVAGALWVGGVVGLAILAGVVRSLPARHATRSPSVLLRSRGLWTRRSVLARAGDTRLSERPRPAATASRDHAVARARFMGVLALGGYHRRPSCRGRSRSADPSMRRRSSSSQLSPCGARAAVTPDNSSPW